MIIKSADVDVEIIPIIKWLNSYLSVNTHFCCQGDPDTTKETDNHACNRPYVLFTCMNPVDLVSVLSVLGHFSTVEIHWNQYKAQIEYISRFTNKERLLDAIDYIKVRSEELASQMMY